MGHFGLPHICAYARVDSPAVDFMIPLALSGSGVFIAAVAYYNRGKPQWQRDMRRLMILAVGQVALGFVSYLVLVVAR